jgi:ADP-ribosylglycohydrolase
MRVAFKGDIVAMRSTKSILTLMFILTIPPCVFGGQKGKVLLNEADFLDRVVACWLGKNIGGTLGMPFEGKQQPQDVSYYINLKPGEPAANDDLDLQLLWLKAMEEHGGRVDARILGEYWTRYVIVDWNEYGVGIRNMKLGLLPPLSGHYDNAKWRPSNGAWIRSEIWACLAPGCPGLAARLAREDACVDHGAAEGTLAEIFTVSIESAAFIEHDRDKLIAIGLSMIPADSGLAAAIRAALDARKAGKDWRAAREDVIRASDATGWFEAPRDVGFMIIGWLYGDGDFGKSISMATNCGDDTDCQPATLGAILGILNGTKGIPENWSRPIGRAIKTVAIGGFTPPADIDELARRTVAMTKRVVALNNAPVGLTDGPSDLRGAGALELGDPATGRELSALSPYLVVWNETDVVIAVDYLGEPMIQEAKPRALKITLHNPAAQARRFSLRLVGYPEGWKIAGLPEPTVEIPPGAQEGFDVALTAGSIEKKPYRLSLEVGGAQEPITIPITLIGKRAGQS